LRKRSQVIPNDDAKVVSLLAIHSRGSGFHVTRSSRLHFNKAEDIVVPANQINFTMMPRRTVIACDHAVSAMAQVEISVFLTAFSGAEMGRSLRINLLRRDPIQQAKAGLDKVT